MSSNQKKKVGLNSVISWGASVVIIGLMFKILHWPFGELFISLGLLTEAFLFFILGIASMAVVEDDGKAADGSDKGGSALHDLLATSITPKVVESLSNGFKQFNTTVASVNQIAGSMTVTQNLIKEIEAASGDVKKFRDGVTNVTTGFDSMNKSIQAIGQLSNTSVAMMKDLESADQGLKAFSTNMNKMNTSFDQLSKTIEAINQMTQSSATMLKEFDIATQSMKAYNKNLSDLSRVYAAQLEAFKR